MISFSEAPSEPLKLKTIIEKANLEKFHIVSLTDSFPDCDYPFLSNLACLWQNDGYGICINESGCGEYDVSFSLNGKAIEWYDEQQNLSFRGRLKAVSRSDWLAFAALLVSIIALLK